MQGREFRIYKLYLKTYQRTRSKDSKRLKISGQDITIKSTVFTTKFYIFNLVSFYIFINYIQCDIYYEVMKSPQESFRIYYFLYIVDKVIATLQNRFDQFKIYEDIFGFLFSIKKLKSLSCILLKEKCLNLQKYLLDLDGLDLFFELNILKGDCMIRK